MAASSAGFLVPARHSSKLAGGVVSYLEREGEDPPVLLLHGWGASALTFAGLLELARTPRRLLALDLPGFGASPLGRPDWSRETYAELVLDLLRERSWPSASLFGHSYGGGVAIRLAAGQAAPLDRLLLCAPSGLPAQGPGAGPSSVQTFKALRKVAERTLPRSLSRPLVEWLRQHMGSSDYRTAGVLRPILVRAVSEDLTEAARSISIPTLLTWGRLDQELPLDSFGRPLQRLIGPSELVEFPESGHFPFLDEPGRFAAVFDSFFDAKL